jgi:hypothetical protein
MRLVDLLPSVYQQSEDFNKFILLFQQAFDILCERALEFGRKIRIDTSDGESYIGNLYALVYGDVQLRRRILEKWFSILKKKGSLSALKELFDTLGLSYVIETDYSYFQPFILNNGRIAEGFFFLENEINPDTVPVIDSPVNLNVGDRLVIHHRLSEIFEEASVLEVIRLSHFNNKFKIKLSVLNSYYPIGSVVVYGNLLNPLLWNRLFKRVPNPRIYIKIYDDVDEEMKVYLNQVVATLVPLNNEVIFEFQDEGSLCL